MFEGRGPWFSVDFEQFAEGCPVGQGDYQGCNAMLGLCFLRGAEGAPTEGMNPAALVCHGLRRVTGEEAAYLRDLRQPVPDQICDIEVRYVPETGENL
jgi:hypothetical protein